MLISDLVGQYQNPTSRAQIKGAKGVQKLVSTLKDMETGKVFEGTVNSVKGGKVILGLSNGQEVTARMDGKVKLNVGESMFFQVKSNEGNVLSIRPYTVGGSNMNLTLMEALKAAGLPLDERNLSMVKSMMEEQMSIDRNSLAQMSRVAMANGEIDVQTLVQMQKLNLPITPEMSSQFQNYLADKQAIGKELMNFMQELPAAMADENMTAEQMLTTGKEIFSVITEGLSEEIPMPVTSFDVLVGASMAEENIAQNMLLQGNAVQEMAVSEGSITQETAVAEGNAAQESALSEGNTSQQTAMSEENAAQQTAWPEGNVTQQMVTPEGNAIQQGMPLEGDLQAAMVQTGDRQTAAQVTDKPWPQQAIADKISAGIPLSEQEVKVILKEETSYPSQSIGGMLNEEEYQELSQKLKQIDGFAEDAKLFTQGMLRKDVGSVTILKSLQQLINNNQIQPELFKEFLGGKAFPRLLEDAFKQQWMVKPEEITKADAIEKLYEHLDEQMSRLENIIHQSGSTNETVSQLATEIRNNVEFMNVINENYTYVQIPLQMSGQNASGELYVYTNKKNLQEGQKELTAFLHLDMDHLGSTDVSVRMHNKDVSTKFYFDNDAAYELVQANAPILEARLKAKGYNCSIQVENDGKKVNFVDDFLKKDAPASGLVHRYSFDMRA